VAVQDDARILIGGLFTSVNNAFRGRIARLNADGTLDAGFQNGMVGANSLVRVVTVQPDGKIPIGGDFNFVNNIAAFNFARLYREVPALRLSLARPTTNGILGRVTGPASTRVVLQVSPNLVNWISVSTNSILPVGVLPFNDPD